jgi:rhodanese-related sulfurtransferase
MRNYPISGNDWVWWPSETETGPNTDKVDDWLITPRALRRRLDRGEPVALIDVRERWEAEIASLAGSRLIPINELAYRAEDEIDLDEEIVLYDHHGIRSMEAAVLLWDLGYEHVKSLVGGIHRWALEVDPKLPRY